LDLPERAAPRNLDERFFELARRGGEGAVRAQLERILARQLEQIGELIECTCDEGVVHEEEALYSGEIV
jgi:hypothetical protein